MNISTNIFNKIAFVNFEEDSVIEYNIPVEGNECGVVYLQPVKRLDKSIAHNNNKSIIVLFNNIENFPEEEFKIAKFGKTILSKCKYSKYFIVYYGSNGYCTCVQVGKSILEKYLPLEYSEERLKQSKSKLDIFLEELMKETWKPYRVIDWCFDNEEIQDFNRENFDEDFKGKYVQKLNVDVKNFTPRLKRIGEDIKLYKNNYEEISLEKLKGILIYNGYKNLEKDNEGTCVRFYYRLN